jgi:hypothetical protein
VIESGEFQPIALKVSEGEIVEPALRAADLRALVVQIRSRSQDAAMELARGELKAARSEARNGAA